MLLRGRGLKKQRKSECLDRIGRKLKGMRFGESREPRDDPPGANYLRRLLLLFACFELLSVGSHLCLPLALIYNREFMFQ